MKKLKFNYRGKKIELDAKICLDVFSQGLGLMFGFRRKPLLFVWKKSSLRKIHSFFCKPFVAIWFLGNEIIDVKIINDWKFSIKPREKFDRLLEVPSDCREFYLFTDGRKV